MTADAIIDGLLQREGGWRDAVPRPDGSWDPATNKGITLPTLQAWWVRSRPEGHYVPGLEELRALTDEEAAQIYTWMFVIDPGFTKENIPFEPLRVQLIDFGVNSGPERAVRWLQRVLRLPAAEVDGILGPKTIKRVQSLCQLVVQGDVPFGAALVNDALVAARSYMIDQAVDQGAIRKQDEEGLESRALSFFLARP